MAEAPGPLSTDLGTATVLVLRMPGSRTDTAELQVCCRDTALARRVLDKVRLGDDVIALGTDPASHLRTG